MLYCTMTCPVLVHLLHSVCAVLFYNMPCTCPYTALCMCCAILPHDMHIYIYCTLHVLCYFTTCPVHVHILHSACAVLFYHMTCTYISTALCMCCAILQHALYMSFYCTLRVLCYFKTGPVHVHHLHPPCTLVVHNIPRACTSKAGCWWCRHSACFSRHFD